MQVPICRPSGEQIDWPGVVQELVEEPVDAMTEPEVVAALEPVELSAGEAATAEAAGEIEGEVAGAAAAEDDENSGLPVSEA